MPEVMLVGVSKYYGDVVALEDVNLKVFDREYFCVIGPSGCGKSTLLKIIAGIVRQDKGNVYINGKLVDTVPIEERGVGLMFQEIYLFPHMNVWDNIVYSPNVRALDPVEVVRIGRELIDTLSLSFRRKNFPEELSLGLQQKVALARALASGAKLLLLDEPLGSIDPRSAIELRFELRRLVKDLGLTAIHVTHNQEEAMLIADRIAVLRKGRVVQIGTPEELYFNPQTPFVARFIGGENNFLVGEVVREEGYFKLVDVDGLIIRCYSKHSLGKKVVLSIRPEMVFVLNRRRGSNSFKGVVLERSFLGKYLRYLIKLENGVKLIVKTSPELVLNEGDETFINLQEDRIIVFKYPSEGIDKAITYE
mgnify:CR=1 FL=1